MSKAIYFDNLSVHNYLESEYGLDLAAVWQTTLGSKYWFCGSIDPHLPDGTTVAEQRRDVYDYHGFPVQVITWREVPSDYYSRRANAS